MYLVLTETTLKTFRMKRVVPLLQKIPTTATKSLPDLYSFYSSHYNGIVTNPTLATIPVDDHGFHRGHCVFDTCNVTTNNQVYALDMHLDRLTTSARAAGILNHPSKADLRHIVLSTVAAASSSQGKRQNNEPCFVRYWMTSGRGDFSISPKDCGDTGFFVVVHSDGHSPIVPLPAVTAVTVKEEAVNLKPPQLSTMKSNNYLLNALLQMEAEKAGADMGIQLDPSTGDLTESSVSTVAVVLDEQDNDALPNSNDVVFVVPPFDRILASTTVRRAMDLLPSTIVTKSGTTRNVRLEQRHVPQDELYRAKELIDFGGHFCRPIGQVDDTVVKGWERNEDKQEEDGVFLVYEAVARALLKDMDTNEEMLDDVDYDIYE